MTGHRTRLSIGLALLVLLALALPAAHATPTSPQESRPLTAPHRTFLPLVGFNFPSTTPIEPVRFWAERYALDFGQCTTLHWRVLSATAVYLDGEGVALTGSQQECPAGASQQFYWLEVLDAAGESATYEVDLTPGNPGLAASEVIAQADVQSVTPVADADLGTPGNQGGYALHLTNVVVFYANDGSWAEHSVTLSVTQALIDQVGFNDPVHWPIRAGQLVEFRATCNGAACSVVSAPSYLYLRSE